MPPLLSPLVEYLFPPPASHGGHIEADQEGDDFQHVLHLFIPPVKPSDGPSLTSLLFVTSDRRCLTSIVESGILGLNEIGVLSVVGCICCVSWLYPNFCCDDVRAHHVGLIKILNEQVESEVDDDDQKVSDDDVFPPSESCREML